MFTLAPLNITFIHTLRVLFTLDVMFSILAKCNPDCVLQTLAVI